MAVRIAQASKDERGKYSGGKAGDQGGELNIRTWYNRPWDAVLRPLHIGDRMAEVAKRLVGCSKIGYDQSQRTTLYEECEKIGWDLSRIDSIAPCECDCSSLIAVIAKFSGVDIPKTVYTGNLSYYLLNSGEFVIFRDQKYVSNDSYLRRGDIVLNTAHHVAVVLDTGSKAAEQGRKAQYAAQVRVNTYLNVRTGPGTMYPCMKVNGQALQLPNGLVVAICEEADGWGRLLDLQAWVSLSYLQGS